MYIYIYIYIYICIHTYVAMQPVCQSAASGACDAPSLATDKWGEHSSGRCKSNEFWQIGGIESPGTFWEYRSRLTGVPKSPSVKKHETCSDPVSADPIRPFPKTCKVT